MNASTQSFRSSTVRPNLDLSPVLEKLKTNNGNGLFIISSNSKFAIKLMLAIYGLDHFFKKILGYEFMFSKEDKIIHAVEEFGTDRENTYYICDTAGDVKEAVGRAAVDLARDLKAAAIVTPTSTGRTPRAIARHRPPQPILALSPDPHVVRALALVWGVVPGTVPGFLSLDALISAARERMREEGIAAGSPVVLTMGYPQGKGLTNTVLVVEA